MTAVPANLQPTYRDARVVITGGVGFIGSHLARRLVDLGARVTLIDSMVPEYGGNLHNLSGIEDRLRINFSDVRDPYTLPYLLRGADFLFNLAGQTSHLDSMTSPHTDLDINCAAQLSILEACRRHAPDVKIVFASTRQIYGVPQRLPVDEDHPINPVDINGVHKLAAEQYHLLYNKVYGLRATAARLTNTYGPCMRVKDARQTFLGIWVRCVVEGKPFEVWGTGEQLRDFNYVDDAVDALLAMGATDDVNGQSFNLGSRERISLKALGELVVEVAGGGDFRVTPFPPERKRIDIGDYYGDHSRLSTAVGWEPRVSLSDGLRRTIEYYREHLARYVDAT